MATLRENPAKAVKLLVGPTYKIPVTKLKGAVREFLANQRYAQKMLDVDVHVRKEHVGMHDDMKYLSKNNTIQELRGNPIKKLYPRDPITF